MNLRPLLPLLVAAFIMLAGNGLQGTLIAIRGAQEGFSTGLIGFMGTAYFGGFLLGCVSITRMLSAVGHIRTFAALAAIAASGTLMLVLVIDGIAWVIIRFVMGFCFAGLFTTIESWLNAGVSNETRGRVLSIYRIIDLVAVTGAQFMLPVFGAGGFAVFAVMALMITISLVPVSLADRSSPKPPKDFHFDMKAIWALSPIACIGAVAIGATNSAFRLIGPIYAQDIGLSIASVATFMSAGIIGGAVLQYPLGVLSDLHDRRLVLILTSLGAVLAGLYLGLFAGTSPLSNYIGIFLFGAFALPLYSLSVAHANDHAEASQYVMVAAGLMFCFSVGAIIGPFVSSFIVQTYGPASLFTYTGAVHGTLILATIWRMRMRGPAPAERRGAFTMLLRTSPALARLANGKARKTGGTDGQSTNRADVAKDLNA
ncbi:MFS transporter [Oricola cellulosilytica]|uniref:MFS transporter n=1 Tax=Oricola cellulosilytica TaxID=1429082 RepID=A0A4R0PBB2_9HYPH|nr:MFS transporter [Oricola cellulosilytica]TCD14336.1 MFS transporter [Oricola cellulosilytica]